ncbi:integron integrase [Thermodesulfatator indicus]
MKNSWHNFTDYLNKLPIPEKAKPFYVSWVKKALCWTNKAQKKSELSPISENNRKRFIKFLETRYEPWQVAQAEEAIKLYNYFISSVQTSSPEKPDQAAWSYIKEEACRLMRLRHLSYRTEKTYLSWIEKFQKFTNSKAPVRLTARDFQDFLTHLAVERRVAPSTQNQALNALVFLYKHVLQQDITAAIDAVRARERRRLPVVLEKEEVERVLQHMPYPYHLIGGLMYGGGLRLSEALNLRVKDVNFEKRQILVRAGKGDKDRVTILPEKLADPLWEHLQKVRQLYEFDREENLPGIHLPEALARKYPNAGKEWGWYWLFPSPKLSVDPRTLTVRRHHLYPTSVQRAFKRALAKAGIEKPANVHSLRHSFATHLLEAGYHIRTVQELLGHKHIQTTMIYTHLARQKLLKVQSPLDRE